MEPRTSLNDLNTDNSVATEIGRTHSDSKQNMSGPTGKVGQCIPTSKGSSAVEYQCYEKAVGISDDHIIHDPDPIVPATDDITIPVGTFRAWSLGLLFSVIGAGINDFFAERLPGIGMSGFVAQLIAYPAGKFMERTLPARTYRVLGYQFTLNPGPFSAKEHMLITIISNVSFGSAHATSVIITQRLPQFYNQQWASNWTYQILLVVSTQIMGYGLAGMSRRFLVYPAAAQWPNNLAVITLNKSFHDTSKNVANGWRISQLRWFSWVFLASGLYFFIPNYLCTAISQFNWSVCHVVSTTSLIL